MDQQKLYQKVESDLAEDIASGLFEPGKFLPTERELMERFGVGRPSIREALFSLSKRGLVKLGSGRRPTVMKPSFEIVIKELSLIARQVLQDPENVIHLIELREVLEGGLASRAASVATDEQIAELKERLEKNRLTLGTYEPFWASDTEFHSYIAKIVGNPLIPIVLKSLHDWLIEQRRVTVWEPGVDKISYEHHVNIFNAISDHDPERAEREMIAHLNYTKENAMKILKNKESKIEESDGKP